MAQNNKSDISPARLRLGVLFIILFWIPVWLLVPVLADFLAINSDVLLVTILIIQTVFGLIGALIVGKLVVELMRRLPKKKVLPGLWHAFIHGELNQSD